MSHVVWPNLLPLTLRLHASEAILGTGYPLEAFESDEFARPVLETLLDVARGVDAAEAVGGIGFPRAAAIAPSVVADAAARGGVADFTDRLSQPTPLFVAANESCL